jgi:membrane fusion protein (multidrug efflux system)
VKNFTSYSLIPNYNKTMEQNENKNVETAEATQVSHEETRKKLKKQRVRQIIASLIGVAILAFGLWKIVCLFLDYSSNETSNDAQIEQYISPVNLRASGYIAKVCFREHQEVHKGDTLLVLDDREYRIRLMEAEAALKDAKAGANVINATEQTTETSASIYQASIDEINVRLAKLAKDCERYRNLVEKKAATPIQLEQLEVEYAATRKKLEGVKKQQAAAYKGVNEVTTRKQNVAASIERAEAAVEMAKLNLSYCVVVAPCDGKLGRRSIEEGQMVNAGTTITYIIPTNNKWVIANYKETQIENLYVGQKVRMTVDAISNKEFEGTVTAISGATGSKYSLVPTDNSAGNFVKIQQRVPVRIDFNNLSKEDNEHLAAGMMVVVKAERK